MNPNLYGTMNDSLPQQDALEVTPEVAPEGALTKHLLGGTDPNPNTVIPLVTYTQNGGKHNRISWLESLSVWFLGPFAAAGISAITSVVGSEVMKKAGGSESVSETSAIEAAIGGALVQAIGALIFVALRWCVLRSVGSGKREEPARITLGQVLSWCSDVAGTSGSGVWLGSRVYGGGNRDGLEFAFGPMLVGPVIMCLAFSALNRTIACGCKRDKVRRGDQRFFLQHRGGERINQRTGGEITGACC